MLLWRAKELLEGGGELLKAEAELAGMRLQRMLVGLACYAILAVIGLIGLLSILTGLSILLAQSIGWPVSLLIVGGGVLISTALCVLLVLRMSENRQPEMAVGSIQSKDAPPEAEAQQAKERMAQAIDEDADEQLSNPLSGLDQLKDEAIEFAARNPLAVGSAALLAVSAIGPLRSARLFSRGVATAGLVGSLIDAMKSGDDGEQQDPDMEQSNHTMNGSRRPTPQGT